MPRVVRKSGGGKLIAIRRALEPGEKLAAKERQGERTDKHRGNLPQGSGGKTRDKVAAFTGVSGRTLDKADALEAYARQAKDTAMLA